MNTRFETPRAAILREQPLDTQAAPHTTLVDTEDTFDTLDPDVEFREKITGDLVGIHDVLVSELANTTTIDIHRAEETDTERKHRELAEAQARIIEAVSAIDPAHEASSPNFATSDVEVAYTLLRSIDALGQVDNSHDNITTLVDDAYAAVNRIKTINAYDPHEQARSTHDEATRTAQLRIAQEIEVVLNAYTRSKHRRALRTLAGYTLLDKNAIFIDTHEEPEHASTDTEPIAPSPRQSKKIGGFISRRLRKH